MLIAGVCNLIFLFLPYFIFSLFFFFRIKNDKKLIWILCFRPKRRFYVLWHIKNCNYMIVNIHVQSLVYIKKSAVNKVSFNFFFIYFTKGKIFPTSIVEPESYQCAVTCIYALYFTIITQRFT